MTIEVSRKEKWITYNWCDGFDPGSIQQPSDMCLVPPLHRPIPKLQPLELDWWHVSRIPVLPARSLSQQRSLPEVSRPLSRRLINERLFGHWAGHVETQLEQHICRVVWCYLLAVLTRGLSPTCWVWYDIILLFCGLVMHYVLTTVIVSTLFVSSSKVELSNS